MNGEGELPNVRSAYRTEPVAGIKTGRRVKRDDDKKRA